MKQFYTDSQGTEMTLRQLDHRFSWNYTVNEPISGNYYPITLAIMIKDNNDQFSFVTDRSHGATSLNDGELEVMMHRRLLKDDSLGVEEPLNETTVIYTKDYLLKSRANVGNRHLRRRMQLSINPIQFAYGDPDSIDYWRANYNLLFSPLNSESPPNVYIQTLRPVMFPDFDNRYILRLRHIYAVGEDDNLSKPVSVDINNLFKNKSVTVIKEMNLLGTIEKK